MRAGQQRWWRCWTEQRTELTDRLTVPLLSYTAIRQQSDIADNVQSKRDASRLAVAAAQQWQQHSSGSLLGSLLSERSRINRAVFIAGMFEGRHASIKYAMYMFEGICCAITCGKLVDPWAAHALVNAHGASWGEDGDAVAYRVDQPERYTNRQKVNTIVQSVLVHHSPWQCMQYRTRNHKPLSHILQQLRALVE